MDTVAVVMRAPEQIEIARLPLDPPGAGDVVVETAFSGISTGTERLLWSGRMPAFPGMGYPLVPGYETVGRVVDAGDGDLAPGTFVFVPGARCFGDVRGLFGGAAHRLVVPRRRVTPVDRRLGADAVLLALAATAHHAIAGGALPDLVVGHGVLGRLVARITVALGGSPTVHETRVDRRGLGDGYRVVDPAADERRDYRTLVDVSGDAAILDALVGRAAKGAEIVLAGFYEDRPSFAFPPAFMREIRFRIAAEWQPEDLDTVLALVAADRLDLSGLVTHALPASAAGEAYRIAFGDAACLKMVLDWSGTS